MATPIAPARHSLDIVLLTRPGCAQCADARRTVTRLSRRFPLTIADLDIDSPAGRELAERGNVPFVPAIFVGGVPFAYGRIGERSLRGEIERRLAGARASPPPGKRLRHVRWTALLRGW
jgi:glutaredoxin